MMLHSLQRVLACAFLLCVARADSRAQLALDDIDEAGRALGGYGSYGPTIPDCCKNICGGKGKGSSSSKGKGSSSSKGKGSSSSKGKGGGKRRLGGNDVALDVLSRQLSSNIDGECLDCRNCYPGGDDDDDSPTPPMGGKKGGFVPGPGFPGPGRFC